MTRRVSRHDTRLTHTDTQAHHITTATTAQRARAGDAPLSARRGARQRCGQQRLWQLLSLVLYSSSSSSRSSCQRRSARGAPPLGAAARGARAAVDDDSLAAPELQGVGSAFRVLLLTRSISAIAAPEVDRRQALPPAAPRATIAARRLRIRIDARAARLVPCGLPRSIAPRRAAAFLVRPGPLAAWRRRALARRSRRRRALWWRTLWWRTFWWRAPWWRPLRRRALWWRTLW